MNRLIVKPMPVKMLVPKSAKPVGAIWHFGPPPPDDQRRGAEDANLLAEKQACGNAEGHGLEH
jgi:hypothetical protein